MSSLLAGLVLQSVMTPAGPRPASDVHLVESGMVVRDLADRYEVYRPETGEVKARLAKHAPRPRSYDGWVTYASWTNESDQPISSFATTWAVPAVPATSSGQTIFYFNGIENRGRDKILQPVLQWGSSDNGGGKYWTAASWYVGSDGQEFYSKPVQVNVGDKLTGVMTLTGQSFGGFDYQSEFQGLSGTELKVQAVDELVWANETLEAYGASDCSDYPATAKVAFYGIDVMTGKTAPALRWETSGSGDCGEDTVVPTDGPSGGEVDIVRK
jgi:hypothetical protein